MLRLIALCLLLLPAPAVALSCLPWGIGDGLSEARTAKEGYLPVVGRLTFIEDDLPKVDWSRQQDTPPRTRLKAYLSGKAWNGRSVATQFAQAIHLDILCAGPWCASAVSGETVLALLRQDVDGHVLTVSPCGGMLFYGEEKALRSVVKACLARGDCPASAAQQD